MYTPPNSAAFKKFATLRRTLGLLRSFPLEQSDPHRFYTHLAQDTALLIGLWEKDTHLLCADIGAGTGYFAQVFTSLGYSYLAIDPEYQVILPGSKNTYLRASGFELPLCDDSVDIVLSSNVLEHVSNPFAMAEEMLRICKPGGTIALSYTIWFGPFGGHETGLWHYLGGKYAARRYKKKKGKPPKNNFGQTLFRIDVRDGLGWVKKMQRQGKISQYYAFPRYHPYWAHWLVKVPGMRELLVSNLLLMIKKTERNEPDTLSSEF